MCSTWSVPSDRTTIATSPATTAPVLRQKSVVIWLLQQDESSSAGQQNHEIHHEQHQVVVPAVCSASPKADLPHEDLFLNRPEHEQDQPDGGELRQDPQRHAHTPEHFGNPEKDGEPGARPDVLRPLGGALEVIPPAIEEHGGHHESQEQHTDIAEVQ